MFQEIDTSYVINDDLSRLKGLCYLDHAGSALYTNSQINNVMTDLKMHLYGNPHSSNNPSVASEELINNIRFKVLQHFNTSPKKYSVIFTSGATAALKTVAECFAWDDNNYDRPKNSAGSPNQNNSTFAYTQDNHTSVLGMRELAPDVNILCLTRKKAHEALDNKSWSHSPTDYIFGSRNSLFAYPVQSNFAGTKYPLKWVEACQNGALNQYTDGQNKSRWYVVLDASSYVSTNELDLDTYSPDFVAISFYKMFGYPTGLGALLVNNETGITVLRRKKYFGGGTVEVVFAHKRYHVFKKAIHDRFEDGTIDFLSVIAVGHGLDTLRAATVGSMKTVAERTFQLSAYLYNRMHNTQHGNGCPVFRMYADTTYQTKETQGGIVNFNILRANGEYVGYNEVNNVAKINGIVVRVGCFCNPGACQAHLGLTDQELRRNQEVIGHVCGDHIDLVNGRPTGSVRVSFGYQSNKLDADTLYSTLVKHFWQKTPIESIKQKPIAVDDFNKINLRVSRLFVYPIKSCGAFEMDEWQLESYGFLYDRNWAVVSESGVCMTQIQEPKLCLVRPFIDLHKETMTLVYAENQDEVPMMVPLDTNDNDRKKIGELFWGGSVEGIDCGDEVASWLSLNINRPGLRLIRCTGRNSPKVNIYGCLNPKIVAANRCQYLLTTNSTLKWLQEELQNDITNIEEDNLLFRFRGNIVISGDELPAYDELTWKSLAIGEAEFQQDSACQRCNVVNIDQATSESNYKPLSVLAQHKQQGKCVFGIYLNRFDTNGCKIRVGQQCVVIDRIAL